MTKTRMTAALAALMLGLTACGGAGAASGDDAKASKAISDSIMKQQQTASGGAADVFKMKRTEADCIGDGLVENVGTDNLKKYGFLTKDLKTAKTMDNVKMSAEDAKAASDTLFDCADVKQMVNKAMGDVDQATKACLDKVMTEDALRQLFTMMFQGKSDEAGQKLVAPMMKCTMQTQQ